MARLTLPDSSWNFEPETGDIWGAIRPGRPLLHHLTNRVAAPVQALAAAALGARPLMSSFPPEVAGLAASSDAILFNLGTPTGEGWDAMQTLIRHECFGKPLLLDPVGVGASDTRAGQAKRILESGLVSVCKGNASEIRFLARGSSGMRGVDAGDPVEGENAGILARRFGCIVAITGPEDIVSDGERTWRVRGGSELLPCLPASGCLAGTVSLACLAVRRIGSGVLAGLLALKLASERAERRASGIGSFQSALADALWKLGSADASSGVGRLAYVRRLSAS